MIAKLLTECVGTFFLLLTVLLAADPVGGVGPLAPLAVGATLIAMIYMGGSISMAHYNPAVTLGFLVNGTIKPLPAAGYVVAQLVGAAAACAAFAVSGRTAWAPAPRADASPLAAWGAEILFTFALMLVILNVAASSKTRGNQFYGVAIGMAVIGGALCCGGLSGAAFNPAVGLAPNLLLKGAAAHTGLYGIAPCAGAVLAAIVFKLQHRSQD